MTNTEKDNQHPEFLVETDWLEKNLSDPDLRVFDCTVIADLNPDPNAKFPFVFESGRTRFNEGHIPGAGFLNLLDELSDTSSELPFLMPGEPQLVNALGKAGIGGGTRVVLYGSAEPIWAARVWWMLRAFGFNSATILNGGWAKWSAEGRPASIDACTYAPAQFSAHARPECFTGKDEVLAAINENSVRTINALPPMMFSGEGGAVFGRKGRIPGSVNVPFNSLHDPDTGAYLPVVQLREIFDAVGVGDAERIIAYCGSGITASNDAFALAMLGYENVAVYDASLAEWGYDEQLPMEKG
ncbi:MAG: sulfurtransferase [Rhodospirillales bacterium]|nr:sulfurtransferase [Rhodospirillales bacterium]